MHEITPIRTVVLVEGESDAAAVRALARLVDIDLVRRAIAIVPAGGVTNFARVLATFALSHPHAAFCGVFDVAEERHVRRALARAGFPVADASDLGTFGFFACVADLEDELIRALGVDAVEGVITAQGELGALRRFQAMPQHRGTPVPQQLRRFLGTRATRKIRSARRLVEALTADQLPRPLAQLAARLLDDACSAAPWYEAGYGRELTQYQESTPEQRTHARICCRSAWRAIRTALDRCFSMYQAGAPTALLGHRPFPLPTHSALHFPTTAGAAVQPCPRARRPTSLDSTRRRPASFRDRRPRPLPPRGHLRRHRRWGPVPHPFRRIAIVNRGEPAVRFIKAVRDFNRLHGESLVTIALYTDGDQRSRFVREADERVELGPEADESESWRRRAYLDPVRLERALRVARADAAWVGWGFVAERPEFVDLCQRIGVTFIGPPAAAMRLLGDKIAAKRLATQVGIPVVPWAGAAADTLEIARAQAQHLGYPLVLKASAGIGGRAMRVVNTPAELADAFDATRLEARRTFGHDAVFVERWIDGARHREVQVAADRAGNVWALDVRGATVQRRHQKVIEESPAPDLPLDIDRAMRASAVRLCRAAGFENVGAVEFLYEPASRLFHFMEVNPWLQVEHPVTELTTGIDLAMLQIDLARGGLLKGEPPPSHGHAVEVRLTVEDAERGFAPAPGVVRTLRVPTRQGLRLDSGVNEGDLVRPEYDSMFAKLIATGRTRDEAFDTLAGGLADATIIVDGGVSNRAFLEHLVRRPEVRAAAVTTDWLDGLAARGQHVSREHGDVALLQAAIDVYEAEFVEERDEFFASAQRFRPRVSQEVGRTIEFRYRGDRYTLKVYRLSVEHYRIDVDGVRVDVWVDPIAANVRTLTCAGTRYRVITSRVATMHLIEVDGALHRVSRDADGDIRALGPAVVVSLSVQAGDRVEVGQRVATLESMKMETAVLSPCAGIVRETSVMQNAQVGAGTRLLVIDPDDVAPAADRAERIRFDGKTLGPQDGGKPASRMRAALVGLRAFASAFASPDLDHAHGLLDDLKALLLGSDIDAAEARRLVEEYRRTCDRLPPGDPSLLRREDEMLEIFADVSSLFRRQAGNDDADDPTALSTGQYFLTYLRTIEARGADLPQAFVADLRRALRHYGSESLDVTSALKSRLFWMYKSHQRIDHQVVAVVAILERRLRHAPTLLTTIGRGFTEILDRLIENSEGQFPALTDLARDVRYRFFEQPIFERGRQAVFAEMEAHLAYVMRDPTAPDRDTRISALVDCPLPLGGLLSGRFEDAAPVLRHVMLEVLTRRFYRIRDVGTCDVREVGSRSVCLAEYPHDDQQMQLLASHAPWQDVGAALQALSALADERPADAEVLIDLYVCRDEALAGGDQTASALLAALAATPFRRRIRRVVFAIAGRRADWAASGTSYYTFRHDGAQWHEDRIYRGLQPMLGKRLGVARFEKFVIERLPSVEDVFLFRATARDNARDERLFALAEVRDVVPVRDEQGALLQIPHLERMIFEAAAAIREVQARRGTDERLHWNRIILDVWPALTIPREELLGVMRRMATHTDGLGLEKVVLRARMPDPDTGELRDTALSMSTAGGHGLVLQFGEPSTRLIEPLDEYTQKVVRMRQRNLIYPYEVIKLLTPGRGDTDSDLPPGEFIEHDLDATGQLVPIERPYGKNSANVVAGIVRNYTTKYPDGVTRVIVIGDPSKEVGSVSEPECSRVLAGLDLAERMGVPFEWFSLSAGAKISMESGTENMDWIGRVLRRLIEFTQAGREVNIVVTGINVGAQPYWNAEATMLMHTKGILVMMPESAMVLTGKTALDYSGSVSAEDNLGIGGYERIMGPNGQAQYFARDLTEACSILLRHYDHSYIVDGDRFPRRAETTDPIDRDVRTFPHGRLDGTDFQTVGDVFSDATNPGRKKPFDIRRVMLAVSDQDHQPLERWAGWRDAEIAVVWDAHVGGYPVCMLGFESRTMARLGFVPTDGPDHWTSGTLFPMASKKVARAINAASSNRPLVVIANLSGFDGSPESMRRRQLEFGAEIGRAITNFRGPIVFVVISRYHGGAFVVFSRTLHDNMQVAALEGTFASVIGGAPAAAVVFARDVDLRTRKDARVVALERELASADEDTKRRLRPRLAALIKSVRSEKLGEVAEEFDRIHSIQRAVQVGSVDQIIPAADLRPWIVQAVERGMAKERE